MVLERRTNPFVQFDDEQFTTFANVLVAVLEKFLEQFQRRFHHDDLGTELAAKTCGVRVNLRKSGSSGEKSSGGKWRFGRILREKFGRGMWEVFQVCFVENFEEEIVERI